MSRGLADTSVFVAGESGRRRARLPERMSVSVVTLGELELGVLAAVDDDVRARRADTLAVARQLDPLPITENVMSEWARLITSCRAAGIQRAVRLADSYVAATAIVHGLPVVTQDADFDRLAAAHEPLRVLRV